MARIDRSRRTFLRRSFTGAGLLAFGGTLFRCGDDAAPPSGSGGAGGVGGAGGIGGAGGQGGSPPLVSNIENLGPLGDPDANGVRLPTGFTSRIVARSGEAPTGSGYVWHAAPDGGAVFPIEDGGWIYVSNCELSSGGGVGALKFSPAGDVIGAYAILDGTSRNCAGGPTPWGTWLSCEETTYGQVYECDPRGVAAASVLPALGTFAHEAVAIDPLNQQLYLTEDAGAGRLYRFTPHTYPDLSAGTLEVMEVLQGNTGATTWHTVPDPSASQTSTRYQVPQSTAFDGGEGIWYHAGVIFFATKGDNRVWAYEVDTGMLSILYDNDTSQTPILTGVDNVYVTPAGDVLVAEDGGDLEIVAITPSNVILPVIQLSGHDSSEITGPAFDPSLTRLYFSSQRGTSGTSSGGITFEISGPFFQ